MIRKDNMELNTARYQIIKIVPEQFFYCTGNLRKPCACLFKGYDYSLMNTKQQ